MIVQCPNCDTKYRLDEARLGQGAARARCSRCSHVFSVSLPPPDDADVVQDSEFDWLKDMNMAGGAENEKEAPPVPDTMSGPLYEKKDGKIFLEIQPSAQPRARSMTRSMAWVLAVIALVSAALILSLYFFPGGKDIIRSTFTFWEREKPAPQPEVLPEVLPEALPEVLPEALTGEHIDLIFLHNVRQYFVTNEKIGQLFVVEGKARNDFSTPMGLIKIKATLFDEQGQVVERQEFLAGNTVSLFQLQTLSEEELHAALQDKVGILSNNTNLQPGMDVPFMAVFANPPDIIQEYELKVVEAQHPPSQMKGK